MSKKRQKQLKRKAKRKVKTMLASKVKLNQDMMAAMNNPIMTAKRRRDLRIQRIKDYIRSKPSGTPMKTSELLYEAGFDLSRKSSQNNGYVFIRGLIEKDIIRSAEIPRTKKKIFTIGEGDFKDKENKVGFISSTVPDSSPKTYSSDKPKSNHGGVRPEAGMPKGTITKKKSVSINKEAITELAKRFAWEYDSDSLREFVKFIN